MARDTLRKIGNSAVVDGGFGLEFDDHFIAVLIALVNDFFYVFVLDYIGNRLYLQPCKYHHYR